MSTATDPDGAPPTRGEARRRDILRAAIGEFADRGVQGTSMANIAEAAGVSRPALYQYFSNKDEIFASAFVELFERLVDAAIDALARPGTPAERLDRCLQRFDGDLWEQMSSAKHLDELTAAKNEEIADSIQRVVARLVAALTSFADEVAPTARRGDRDRRRAAVEVLQFAPNGLRYDQPSVTVFRRRLSALARSVAADLTAG